MSRVTVLGTGHMGSAMVKRLISQGIEVSMWNRTRSRLTPLVELGATAHDSPAKAVVDAEVVITALTDGAAVNGILGEAAPGLSKGTVIAETSTIGPMAVTDLHGRLPDYVHLVDAPVLGSVPAIEAGNLTILAGGDEAAVAVVAAALQPLGTVKHLGPIGTAAAAKLIANTAMVNCLNVLTEAQQLAASLGVSPELTDDLLGAGPLSKSVARRDATGARFAVDLAAKDLRLALAIADLPISATTVEHLDAASAIGLGDHDLAVIAHRDRHTHH